MTLPIAGGAFFVRWLLRSDANLGAFEAIFLGMGVGLGFTAFEIFILGLLKVPFTLTKAGLPILVFTVLLNSDATVSGFRMSPRTSWKVEAPRAEARFRCFWSAG